MPATIDIRAGDTDLIEVSAGATSLAERTTGDVTDVKLYARFQGADANHVDGVALGSVTASSVDNGDGTWDVTITGTFDPQGNKNGGGDAFDVPGTYRCHLRALWSDTRTTRHPGVGTINVVVAESYD